MVTSEPQLGRRPQSSTAHAPLVTIALPTFNGSPHIEAALRSVLAQTYRPLEVVISDDASTDGTPAMLRQVTSEAPADVRVRVLGPTTRLGLTANWNRCIRAASGDVIVLFHQDDLLHPLYVTRVVDVLTEHPDCGLVHAAYECIDERGASLGRVNAGVPYERGHQFVQRLWTGNSVCCPSVAVPRATYDRVGLFDTRFKYCVDYEMWVRIGLSFPVGCVTEASISYRKHPNQETFRMLNEEDARRRLEQFLAPLAALQRTWDQRFARDAAERWRSTLGEMHAALGTRPGAAAWALGFVVRSPLMVLRALTADRHAPKA